MNPTVKIGNVVGEKSHAVSIDLKLMMSTRLLITSDSGGGKTWLLKRLIEQAFGKGFGIIAIDPEGEFAPLREKFDFYLVGKGGETPADVRSAEKVARTLLGARASAICDLYDMRPAERHEWVRLFLEGLIEAPKEMRHPYLIIVDEAHIFCPEKGKGESEAADNMRSLATRGRKRMLCGIYATQRLATLSKDLTGMCLNRLIGPTFESINQKAAARELGIDKSEQRKFFAEVKMLEPGNFYALGRAITKELLLVEVGPITTAHGQEAVKYELKPPPPSDKIKALLARLGDLPKQAEEEARTVADFKRVIRELKEKLREQPKAAAGSAPAPAKVKEPAYKRKMAKLNADFMTAAENAKMFRKEYAELVNEVIAMAEKGAKKLNKKMKKISLEPVTLGPDIEILGGEIQTSRGMLSNPGIESNSQRSATVPLRHNPRSEKINYDRTPIDPPDDYEIPIGIGGQLPTGEKSILIAIAQSGYGGADKRQITILSGYKRSSRDTYMSRLIKRGYIKDGQGDKFIATTSGIAALGSSYKELPTGKELQDYWLGKLPAGESKIFEVVLAAGGNPVSRERITELSGYKRSSRDTYLSRMFAKNIVVPCSGGNVKASENLFS